MAHLTFSKQSRKLPPPYLPQPQGSMLRKPGFGVWRLNMVVPGKLTDMLFFDGSSGKRGEGYSLTRPDGY